MSKMPKLVPYTYEELRKLKGIKRQQAKQRYINWLKQQRKQDKKEMKQLKQKIDNHAYRTTNKEYFINARYSKNNKCPKCGKLITNTANTCFKCRYI